MSVIMFLQYTILGDFSYRASFTEQIKDTLGTSTYWLVY